MKYFVGEITFMGFILLLISAGKVAHAQNVSNIPPNPDFPTAEYPYAQAPDGCSGWSDPSQVRDTWGPVDFTGACNQHDRCYYTVGSNWNTCNERLFSDLRTACERDLRIRILRTDNYLPPDPFRLSTCYQISTTYYAAVQAGVALNVFNEAQDKQRRYEEWIISLVGSATSATPNLSLVLDSNNGSGDLYLHSQSDINNLNHLWRIIGVTDGYYMIVSQRNGHALDANGGTGNLYLHPNPDRANPNHLWRLTQLPGDYWMITSRVNGYALDANGGTGNLYLHPNPDRGNLSHLWKFANINDYTMIGSALRN